MGVSVPAALHGDMRARHERDHRVAMALLTKSRSMLPRLSEKDGSEDTSEQSQQRRRPPLPSAQPAAMAALRKRRAAALAAYEALQSTTASASPAITTKRRRLTLGDYPSSSNPSAKSSSLSPQRARGIARRSASAPGATGSSSSSRLGRPRSLQFALKDLSSSDTRYLLQTLAELPQEIARLNATSASKSNSGSSKSSSSMREVSSQVFGWRNCFLSPSNSSPDPTPYSSSRNSNIIWKARKTFESSCMRPLAEKVWDSIQILSQQQQQASSSKIRKWEHLYSVSKSVRVVRRVDCLFGREERETVWLECFLDRGEHLCIGRRQLTRFRDYELTATQASSAARTDECECEGFLFRPHLTKLTRSQGSDDKTSKLLLGSSLQCVSSVASRGLAADELLRNIFDELPQLTLQWEEVVVHDLLPQIKF